MKYKPLYDIVTDFSYCEKEESCLYSQKHKPFISHNGYWEVRINRSIFKIHRIIFKIFNPDFDEDLCIDHLDGDRLNNKVTNLRAVTHAINNKNQKQHSNSKTGYNGITVRTVKGIAYLRVYVMIDGILKEKYLNIIKNKGYDKTLEIAKEIRKDMEANHFTERHGKC